jgi:membrane fusion protein (multidrug efflux system)
MKTLPGKSLIASTVVGTFCIFLSLGTIGCNPKEEKGTEGASTSKVDTSSVKVVVAEVTEGSFEDWGSYSADLRGIEDAFLTAPYQGGRVNSLKPVGTRVSAGESLCDINGELYRAALDAAKAQVEVTRGDLERAKANVEKGSLGRSAADGANLGYQNSRMVLAAAQRAYDDCQCIAPFDGMLVSSSIDKFQTVAPGMPTVRIAKVDRLEAVISIPESEAFSFTAGMKTKFSLLQSPDRAYEGTLSNIDRAVDTRSRTVSARIVIANRDGSLRPGMVGRASILRKTYAKAIVIPSGAIVRLQNEITVMIAEQGVARQHVIQVGPSTADSTLVVAGLENGDKLIVTGAFQVSDGTRVTF